MNPSQNEASRILENPFFHRGPIWGRRYFFGRKRETRDALQMLRKHQCVSIIGPRHIGETSFLLHLCDPEVQRHHRLGEKHLFVYIDCQGKGNLDKSQFYWWLCEEAKRVIDERENESGRAETMPDVSAQVANVASVKVTTEPKHLTILRRELTTRFDAGELRTLCFDLGIDYDDLPGEGKANKARELIAFLERHGDLSKLGEIDENLRLYISQDNRLTAAKDEFHRVIAMIRTKGYTPIFLFDEFDIIAQNPNLDQDLFSDLRGLISDVIYVTASQDSLFSLTYADTSVLSSPFFNLFFEIRLGFMKPKEAEEMVLGLLKIAGAEHLFSEPDIDFVFKLGGFFPFFIQLVCYRLFEHKLEYKELSAVDYKNVRREYADDSEPHFCYMWKNLDTGHRKAIRRLNEEKGNQINDEQKRWLAKECIVYDGAIFSSVLAEFVCKQVE